MLEEFEISVSQEVATDIALTPLNLSWGEGGGGGGKGGSRLHNQINNNQIFGSEPFDPPHPL
jgi:hypothetical protein